MKPNFKQPVSMVVTQEQFEKDLKKPLIKLGYDIKEIRSLKKPYNLLVNNYQRKLGDVSNAYYNNGEEFDRYFIDHYNPKLFLAIAAMTKDDNKWIVGEYFINKKGKFYQATSKYVEGLSFIKIGSRKATLQELINHFTKKEKQMKRLYSIGYKQAQELIDMSCTNWAERLASMWGTSIALKSRTIAVEEQLIESGLQAAGPEQREIIEKIFPDYFKPKYNFKKGDLVIASDDGKRWYIGIFGKYIEESIHPYRIYDAVTTDYKPEEKRLFPFKYAKPFNKKLLKL